MSRDLNADLCWSLFLIVKPISYQLELEKENNLVCSLRLFPSLDTERSFVRSVERCKFFGLSYFDFVDYVSVYVFLVLAGLFLAVYVGMILISARSNDRALSGWRLHARKVLRHGRWMRQRDRFLEIPFDQP